jgi:hypothetical protein
VAYKSINDQQLRLYMTERNNHSQRIAAARAGFSERTARRFGADPTPPSKRKIVRRRKTRHRPLARFCPRAAPHVRYQHTRREYRFDASIL